MKDYFKNQIVRDLVWVIASPPLFEFLPSDPGIRFFGMDIFSEEYVALEKFIRQLDNNPESLADHIHLGNNRLLGKYYESLTEFWLMHSDRFHLIGRGTQVDGNGETLGEFDFILRDKKKDKFIHLETAGKFYISAGNSGEWNAFIGPNPNDSLQKKMDKLLNSQINLGRTKSGRTRLSEFGINEIDSAVMIKGYFFYHVKNFFRKNFNAPLYSFTNHNKGWWISVASSGTLAEIKAEKWTVLKRPMNFWI